jgi:hypothetical protein
LRARSQKGRSAETAIFPNRKQAKEWAASTESAIRENRNFPHAAAKRTSFDALALARAAAEIRDPQVARALSLESGKMWITYATPVGDGLLRLLGPIPSGEKWEFTLREHVEYDDRLHSNETHEPRGRNYTARERFDKMKG